MNFQQIADSCHFLLNNFPHAQSTKSYLDSRVSQSSQSIFNFGYFPPPEYLSSLSSLISLSTLQNYHLVFLKLIQDALGPRQAISSYFDHFPLLIPFRDVYGNTIALSARTLLQDQERQSLHIPKYKNTQFKKSHHLFGLFENKSHILQQDHVFIVEGQFDVIKAHQSNFKNFVALGSSSMSIHQLALISRFTNNIFLLLDNDEAGLKGRSQILSKFSHLANFKNAFLPPYMKDIDELLSYSPNSLSLTFK